MEELPYKITVYYVDGKSDVYYSPRKDKLAAAMGLSGILSNDRIKSYFVEPNTDKVSDLPKRQ